MKTLTRSILCVGTAAASLAAGVVVSRALQDEPAAAPAAAGIFDQPFIVDDGAATDAPLPLVAPVAVGDDPAILDVLLDGPPPVAPDDLGPEVGRPGGDTPVIGVTTGPDYSEAVPVDGDGDETPVPLDLTYYFDPEVAGIFPWPDLAFDTCAGAVPGAAPSAECPAGYAGTLGGAHIPPAPFMFGAPGHYLTDPGGDNPTVCPASTPAAGAGQSPITVFSLTPLSTLQVRWRPYGTTRAWQSLTIDPATLREQADPWMTRLVAESFDRNTWGLIPRCFVIDRDPNTAYEVELTAEDVFGREVTANRTFSLADANPSLRPPTSARVAGVRPFAEVEAWTTDGGSVTFTTRVITTLGDGGCGSGRAIPDELVHSLAGQRTSPAGVYDSAYTRKVVTSVPLPPAGVVLLCATVYDSHNRLRPAGIDALILQAPTAQRPTITLEGIRLNDGITIPHLDLHAEIRFPGEIHLVNDGCDSTWANPDDLSGSLTVQATLWSCEYASLPVDSTGYVKVPVTITHRVGREYRRQAWGIPIQVDTCDPACPYRPTEWYEIPVPSASSVLCGVSFWSSDDDCPQPTDGVAIVKVEYPIIDGAADRFGTATLVSSSDRPTTDPTAGAPTVYVDHTTITDSTDWSNLVATMSVVSDRAITIQSAQFSDGLGDAGEGCDTRDITVGGAAATEFEIDVHACAGTILRIQMQYTDAAGVAYDTMVGYLRLPAVQASVVHTKIDFLGGDVPNYGWMYEFEAFLDGQTPTVYGWYSWTGTRGASGSQCMRLDDVAADSYTDPQIRVSGGSLEVFLWMNITTTGGTDCSHDGSTGLGRIQFRGSFTLQQLQAREPLVLTTPPDAALQLRVTVNGGWVLSRD